MTPGAAAQRRHGGSEAEATLLRCHAECGASGGDDAQACTLACAQRHLQATGASPNGASRANLTAAPRLVGGGLAPAAEAGRVKGGPGAATHAAPHLFVNSLSDAEAEAILVECHGLCDPKGLVFKGLYDASGTQQQCTMDCAAARMHGESFSGSGAGSSSGAVRETHLTPPPTARSNAVAAQMKGDMKRVLLKCHAQCAAANGDASSTCTMACAKRHLQGSGANSAGAGRANLTAAPRLVASRARTSSPPLGESAEDEDERDIVFMSSGKRR
jgi:hypothetical protein